MPNTTILKDTVVPVVFAHMHVVLLTFLPGGDVSSSTTATFVGTKRSTENNSPQKEKKKKHRKSKKSRKGHHGRT